MERPPSAMTRSEQMPVAGLPASPDVVSDVPHSVPNSSLLSGTGSRRMSLSARAKLAA